MCKSKELSVLQNTSPLNSASVQSSSSLSDLWTLEQTKNKILFWIVQWGATNTDKQTDLYVNSGDRKWWKPDSFCKTNEIISSLRPRVPLWKDNTHTHSLLDPFAGTRVHNSVKPATAHHGQVIKQLGKLSQSDKDEPLLCVYLSAIDVPLTDAAEHALWVRP